jgi:hypothetical protein
MAEILGLGLTHYPPLSWTDDLMPGILTRTLRDPDIPQHLREPAGWSDEMRREWGDDAGVAAAGTHRKRLVEGLRECRRALDAFAPDVVLVWGDDQYENFREEIIPPFCVMAQDDLELQPFARTNRPNAWGEPADTTFTMRGARGPAKELVSGLLGEGFDIAYSYRPREGAEFPHAFVNTMLYLDYDRTGFDYPVIPMSVNCYGSSVISRKGGMASFAEIRDAGEPDPPAPTPARCFALGSAIARVLGSSSQRVALVASSSWSHAFLNDKDWHLHPDLESDRRLYEALRNADYDTWRSVPLADLERDGQHEMLNWFCLLGAMSELGRAPRWCDLVETHVLNSNKCFVVFD